MFMGIEIGMGGNLGGTNNLVKPMGGRSAAGGVAPSGWGEGPSREGQQKTLNDRHDRLMERHRQMGYNNR